jgi:hypothetical protein
MHPRGSTGGGVRHNTNMGARNPRAPGDPARDRVEPRCSRHDSPPHRAQRPPGGRSRGSEAARHPSPPGGERPPGAGSPLNPRGDRVPAGGTGPPGGGSALRGVGAGSPPGRRARPAGGARARSGAATPRSGGAPSRRFGPDCYRSAAALSHSTSPGAPSRRFGPNCCGGARTGARARRTGSSRGALQGIESLAAVRVRSRSRPASRRRALAPPPCARGPPPDARLW